MSQSRNLCVEKQKLYTIHIFNKFQIGFLLRKNANVVRKWSLEDNHENYLKALEIQNKNKTKIETAAGLTIILRYFGTHAPITPTPNGKWLNTMFL